MKALGLRPRAFIVSSCSEPLIPGGRRYSIYPWVGKCGPAPHTLTLFVIEVAKKSGERYPPKAVYGIVCGILLYQG